VVSGAAFYLWRRISEEDRGRVWRLYGWFTALMTCGSCFGAATWVARMMQFSYYLKGLRSLDTSQQYSMFARSYSYRPAFSVTYAIEFLCLSVAKLLVLDRMLEISTPQMDSTRKRVMTTWWCVVAGVFLGNAVGLIANTVAAVYFQKAADAVGAASDFYNATNNSIGNAYYLSHRQELQRAFKISSVQSVCEVAVLLLIVVSFAAAGIFCAFRISSILRDARTSNMDASDASQAVVSGRRLRQHLVATGKRLRLQVLSITAVVFLAFVLRSAFSTMYAIAYELQNSGNAKNCNVGLSFCDEQCYNVYTHILQWMALTPEFQLTIVLLSSPLTLLVALWGLTPAIALRLMKLALPCSPHAAPLNPNYEFSGA
jgi:hypothetical protein